MTENEIAKIVVDSAFRVHTKLGPGLFESVYEATLAYEIGKHGLRCVRQQPVPIEYDSLVFDEGFRADLIVGDTLIVELKSVEALSKVHKKQLLTYLRLTGKKLGLLINFGEEYVKDGIVRIVNGSKE
jgi:GxxExxY protein